MNVRRLMIPLLVIVMVVLLILGLRGNRAGQQDKNKVVEEPTKPYQVAAQPLQAGEEIGLTDITSEQLTDAQAAQRVPTGSIQNEELLIGAIARVAIQPGDFFTPANITPASNQLSQKVEPGFVAVTIPAPPEPSLYDLAFLNPGDRVDIFGVTQDENSGQTVSVRLASNVRLLARDDVISTEQEAARRERLQEEIKALEQERAKAASGTPPATADVLKASYDDPIASKRAEIDPEIEFPSVTVEVTPAQSQTIALWRKTADIALALHREEDAEQIIFDTSIATLPGVGAAGEQGALAPGAGRVLTLDDVVPLDERNPEKFLQRQQLRQQMAEQQAEEQVNSMERTVRVAELQADLVNIRRYGSRTPPPPAVAAVNVPGPALVPVPHVASNAQVDALQKQLADLKRLVKQQDQKAPTQTPLTRSIEVYRGKDKTIVNY